MQNPTGEPPTSPKDISGLCTFKSRFWLMGISKTSDHIQIKINMPSLHQEPSASSKMPNQDYKDMDGLCIFKIKIETQNLEHGCIKDH